MKRVAPVIGGVQSFIPVRRVDYAKVGIPIWTLEGVFPKPFSGPAYAVNAMCRRIVDPRSPSASPIVFSSCCPLIPTMALSSLMFPSIQQDMSRVHSR